MPDLTQMKDYFSIDGEGGWKNISSALEVGVKIYGFKVDRIHNETYSIRGGIL